MVKAAANTGSATIKRAVVIKILQINKGVKSHFMLRGRHTIILVIKFKELKIEETPAKCKEIIKKLTLFLSWATAPLRGGYKVQPIPGPTKSAKALIKTNHRLKGIIQ